MKEEHPERLARSAASVRKSSGGRQDVHGCAESGFWMRSAKVAGSRWTAEKIDQAVDLYEKILLPSVITMAAMSPYARFQKNLEQTLRRLKVSKAEQKLFMSHQYIHKKEIEITKDDGSRVHFPAFRVQYNNARGPYKGGIRATTRWPIWTEVKALAALMAIKTAVVRTPFGARRGRRAV